MQQWDRSRDGLVTYQEFEDYYKGIVINPSDHICKKVADQTLADSIIMQSCLM